jgi:hypothetical protein
MAFFSKVKPRNCVKYNYAAFLGFRFFKFEGEKEKLGLDQLTFHLAKACKQFETNFGKPGSHVGHGTCDDMVCG